MRFVVPRFIALLVVCVGVALTTAGCNPFLDYNYYSQGIGTNVYSSAIGAETQAQDVYLNALCEQAGLQSGIYVEGQYSCLLAVRAGDWNTIVQSGFNDIDQRCDGYLAWLDEQRRLRAPILNEINTIQVAAQNIMGLAAASVKSINIVGLAFGFASNTFTNIQSGLLLEIDKSTVETVVIQGQNNYRNDLYTQHVIIANRAAAIYALRSYLRICTPYTIANQINTTVTLFHSGAGPSQPLIDPNVVRSTGPIFTPASVVQAPVRPPVPSLDPNVAQFFIEKNLSPHDANLALDGLCFDKNQSTAITTVDLIKSLVRIYEATPDAVTPPTVDGKISGAERNVIALQHDCGPAKNYFEKIEYANTLGANQKTASAATLKVFVSGLLSRSPAGGDIPANPSLTNLRSKIIAVRADLKLSDVLPAMNDQITPELVMALQKLPPKQN